MEAKTNPELAAAFGRFVPSASVGYCMSLYHYYGFELSIKRSRKTKFGDYRYDPRTQHHAITINNDLNPYAFLITYLHEVAHMATRLAHQNHVDPHGPEWKNWFRKIAQPVLNHDVFPAAVLLSLQQYFKNPKASSCSDPHLYQVLKAFDRNDQGTIFLKTLKTGDIFDFQGRKFRYVAKQRTRIVCEEIGSKKRYLINQLAEVTIIKHPNDASSSH